ncbi:MAG: hypothetical protein PHS14_06910 [Elusimicrobia bacterium]|nr:hypothetical protein [Elusimicrobiota bacterium]
MKIRALLVFACLGAAGATRAQESWVPTLPRFEFHSVAAKPPEGEPLAANVVEPGLKLLADYDVAGLGAESARADAWRKGRGEMRLLENQGGWSLKDAAGSAFPLSAALGSALRRMNGYFGLSGTELTGDVREELKRLFVTPETVAAVRRVFERSMAETVVSGGKSYTVELGGALTLDSSLRFHIVDDLLRPTLREMVARRDDPAALARLFASEPEKMALLDPMGILKNHLIKRAQWDAENRLTKEKRDAMLHMVIDTVAEAAAGHYSGDYGTQLKGMISDDWSGRYLGNWHCHPPDAGPSGWTGEYPPSEDDYEAAAKNGQETVVAFAADGFDVYLLVRAEKGGSFSRAEPLASYRGAGWREHFQEIFDRLGRR